MECVPRSGAASGDRPVQSKEGKWKLADNGQNCCLSTKHRGLATDREGGSGRAAYQRVTFSSAERHFLFAPPIPEGYTIAFNTMI
jgi:hypothetical protein